MPDLETSDYARDGRFCAAVWVVLIFVGMLVAAVAAIALNMWVMG